MYVLRLIADNCAGESEVSLGAHFCTAGAMRMSACTQPVYKRMQKSLNIPFKKKSSGQKIESL